MSYIPFLCAAKCQWAQDTWCVGQDHIWPGMFRNVLHPWVNLSCLCFTLSAVGQFVTCPYMRFHIGTPSFLDGLWSAVSPFWSRGQLLISSPRACTPSPCLPCKPNTVCVSQYYKEDRNTSRDVRGMTHMHKRRKVFIHKGWSPTHSCSGKRQKLCSSRGVLEEPLTPSSLATDEVKARYYH